MYLFQLMFRIRYFARHILSCQFNHTIPDAYRFYVTVIVRYDEFEQNKNNPLHNEKKIVEL